MKHLSQISAPMIAQNSKSTSIANMSLPSPGELLYVCLVTCLITSLLGTSVFVICSEGGTLIGWCLGYFGAAFMYFARFLSIPIWLAALFYAPSSHTARIQFDWFRLLPCLLFMFYAILQLVFSNPEWSAMSRERLSQTSVLVLLALPLCSRKGCNLFWSGLALTGVIFFVSLLISGQLLNVLRGDGFLRLTSMPMYSRVNLGMDEITSASMMYQCVIAGLLFLLVYVKNKYLWLIGLLICTCLCAIALLTGSKGPLVSFIVAFFTFLFCNRGVKRGIHILLAAGAVLVILWMGRDTLSSYQESLAHLSVGFDDQTRSVYNSSVLQSTPTLFGNGIGSWSVTTGLGVGEYVHNSILEVYYEMGLVGAVLFWWALGAVAWSLFYDARKYHDPLAVFVLAYFVYGLTFSMFSGTIFGNNALLLGLLLGCTRLSPPNSPSTNELPRL